MKTYRETQSAHRQSMFSASLPLRRALNLAILAILYPSFSAANPDGAQIVNGQVSIDTATPGTTTVTNSPNAIINWQNFSIAQNELVQFIQQNGQSAVLNRIIGQNPSEILGQLFSNGKVFLINPNGIVFGAGSSIDTQGLIASSLNLSDQDFLSGNYHFMAGSSAGNIVNEGIIRAGKDGNIILIAPKIENNGIIKSDGGSITLAAGQELTITNLDDPDIRFQIQAPADSVLNLGKLLTEGGAVNVFANSIKHSGEINADSVEMDAQGNIKLIAQQDITLEAGSKVSANNSQGDGGTIHIESKTGTTLAQGTIEAQAMHSASQSGKGGNIALLGERVGVLDKAKINAGGENGGGQILVGGDYQGKNPDIHNAKATYVGKDTSIKADAKTNGDGGKIIVWSNDDTRIHGDLSSQGGSQSGSGGFIETSGAHIEIADTARINTLAPYGKTGTWLIDPNDFTIAASGGDMTGAVLSDNLGSGDITILSSGGGIPGNGDIFVNDSIAKTGATNTTLTLAAERSIIVNSPISSTNSELNVTLQARATDAASGNVWINNNITTNGGNLLVGGGSTPTTGAAIGYNAAGTLDQRYGVYIRNATIYTSGGDITMHGQGVDSATGDADGIDLWDYTAILQAGGGDIKLSGLTGNDPLSGSSGVYIGGTVQTTGIGTISITGTGGTNANIVPIRGVRVEGGSNPASVSTVNGSLSITGTGSSIGSSSAGVQIDSADASVSSSGTGNISIAGNVGNSSSTGVSIFDGGSISTTGNAAAGISIRTDSLYLNGSGYQITGVGDVELAPLGNADMCIGGTCSGVFAIDPSDLSRVNPMGALILGRAVADTNYTGTLTVKSGATISSSVVNGSKLALNGKDVIIESGAVIGTSSTALNMPLDILANRDLTVGGNIYLNDSLTLKANNAIVINAGLSTLGQDVILNADADGSGAGNIRMLTASSINSNNGNIILGGGANPLTTSAFGVTGNPNGIQLTNAVLNAGTGYIKIRGTGLAGTSNADGIRIESSSQLITTSGTINLNGTGGNGTDYNVGVDLLNSALTSTSGELNITGTGQGSGSNTKGISLYSAQVITSGNLNITANGSGSAADVVQSGSGIISNRGESDSVATGSNDVTISGNNITLSDVHSQHDIVLNALGNVNLNLSTNGDYVDDQYFVYNLPNPFTFFGTSYTQAYISSNGLITFDNGTTAYSDSTSALATYKAIAPAWNDWELHTSSGKNIFISQPNATTDLAVKWNVEGYYNSGNTAVFEAVLNSATGSISFNYGAANNSFAGDVTIGLSDGNSTTIISSLNNFTSLNNLTSTTFTPSGGSYSETVAGSGGTLASTTPVYTGTAGFNINTGSTLSALSNITIDANGSITQDGTLTAGSGGNIVLAADSNYINNLGSTAFNVSGGGRWLVYSNSWTSSTENGLTALTGSTRPRLYNKTYTNASNALTNIEAGNHLIYSAQPTITVTANAQTKSYGSTDPTLTYSIAGIVTDDGVTDTSANYFSLSPSRATGENIGSYAISSGYSSAGSQYNISYNAASLVITPALLTLISVTADNATRTYGDANPDFTGTVTAGGLANGDTLSSIGLTYTTLATQFSNVGVYAITPKITNSNYSFTGIDGQLTISPAVLNLYAMTDSRIYNGGTDSTVQVTFTGLRGSDSLSGLSQSFASKNVLGTNGSTLQVNNGYTLDDGNGGNNYTITTHTATGSISPANLNLYAATDSRTYNSGTDSTVRGTSTGLRGSDTLSDLRQSFASKNVLGANGSTLHVNDDYTLDDGNAGNNYTITAHEALGTITPYAVNLTGSRAYDGTTVISSSIFTLGDLVSGETLTLSGLGSVASQHVSAGSQTVTLGTLKLGDGSGLAANYTFTGGTQTASITAATLTPVLTNTDITKTYDGTTAAPDGFAPSYRFDGLVAGDTEAI
ncbi:MAG: MBG domain-containing protein, partial [Methylococcaceae bacterium]